MSEILYYGILMVTGLVAGVINTLAGGGSNLSIPALMLLGMPADIANATNRVSVLMHSVSGVVGFSKHKKLPTDDLRSIILVTLLSGILGTLCAGFFDAKILTYILLGSMVTMSSLMILLPDLILANNNAQPKKITRSPKTWLMLSIAGFYGGLIQAGVGFILLAAFTGALNYDVVRANALKLVCTLVFTIAAVGIFIGQDLIQWWPALALGVGSTIGAWIGVRFSLTIKPSVMRWLLLTMTVVVSALVLFKMSTS